MPNNFVYRQDQITLDGTIPVCDLDAHGSLHDNTVTDFGITDDYDCNGGKVVMDSSFARVVYDFIVKSEQEVQSDMGENVAWQNWQATSL